MPKNFHYYLVSFELAIYVLDDKSSTRVTISLPLKSRMRANGMFLPSIRRRYRRNLQPGGENREGNTRGKNTPIRDIRVNPGSERVILSASLLSNIATLPIHTLFLPRPAAIQIACARERSDKWRLTLIQITRDQVASTVNLLAACATVNARLVNSRCGLLSGIKRTSDNAKARV